MLCCFMFERHLLNGRIRGNDACSLSRRLGRAGGETALGCAGQRELAGSQVGPLFVGLVSRVWILSMGLLSWVGSPFVGLPEGPFQ